MSDPDQFPSRLAEKIVIRLPDGMRDRLAFAARENKRSTNAEVVARLEESLAGRAPPFDVTEFVEELTVRLIQTFELAMNRALFGKNPPELIGLEDITLLGWLESRGVDISKLRMPAPPATSHADGSFDPPILPQPKGSATDAGGATGEVTAADQATPKRPARERRS